MKLYTEQIKYLRQRKKELLDAIGAYTEHCSTRERGGMEGVEISRFPDYQSDVRHCNDRSELSMIEHILRTSEFQTERNFDMVDIGTLFYIDFGNNSVEKAMLVDGKSPVGDSLTFVSTDCDFGKAVLGKHEGEDVSYVVSATGREMKASIKEIDRIKDDYLHFISETNFSKRICNPAEAELKRLKEEDPKEYRRRQALSSSQIELLKEEQYHVHGKDNRRSKTIDRILAECPAAPAPVGPTIQVGSIVEIMLMDGDTPKTYKFEFINKAVSTELEGDYVERISTLGNAIYGKKEGDVFFVRRQYLPSIKGVVVSVTNQDVNKRVR